MDECIWYLFSINGSAVRLLTMHWFSPDGEFNCRSYHGGFLVMIHGKWKKADPPLCRRIKWCRIRLRWRIRRPRDGEILGSHRIHVLNSGPSFSRFPWLSFLESSAARPPCSDPWCAMITMCPGVSSDNEWITQPELNQQFISWFILAPPQPPPLRPRVRAALRWSSYRLWAAAAAHSKYPPKELKYLTLVNLSYPQDRLFLLFLLCWKVSLRLGVQEAWTAHKLDLLNTCTPCFVLSLGPTNVIL